MILSIPFELHVEYIKELIEKKERMELEQVYETKSIEELRAHLQKLHEDFQAGNSPFKQDAAEFLQQVGIVTSDTPASRKERKKRGRSAKAKEDQAGL
jgi:hypothetical protein